MCCIIIHLTTDSFTFNKYCIYKLMYMTVTTVIFRYKFYGFVDVFEHYTEPILNLTLPPIQQSGSRQHLEKS